MSVDMAVKVLDESLGKVVLIKLKGGKVIRGNLHGFDQHMNLLLEDSRARATTSAQSLSEATTSS